MTTAQQQQRWRTWRPTARQQQALSLHAEGLRYAEIGQRLGVCAGRARQLVVGTQERLAWEAAAGERRRCAPAARDDWRDHAEMVTGVGNGGR